MKHITPLFFPSLLFTLSPFLYIPYIDIVFPPTLQILVLVIPSADSDDDEVREG